MYFIDRGTDGFLNQYMDSPVDSSMCLRRMQLRWRSDKNCFEPRCVYKLLKSLDHFDTVRSELFGAPLQIFFGW